MLVSSHHRRTSNASTSQRCWRELLYSVLLKFVCATISICCVVARSFLTLRELAHVRPVAHWQRLVPSPSRSSTRRRRTTELDLALLIILCCSTDLAQCRCVACRVLLTTYRCSNFVLVRLGLCFPPRLPPPLIDVPHVTLFRLTNAVYPDSSHSPHPAPRRPYIRSATL
jgi:hypothetical protein